MSRVHVIRVAFSLAAVLLCAPGCSFLANGVACESDDNCPFDDVCRANLCVPPDTAPPADAGAPPFEDAGTPPPDDAGTPPLDDAGVPPFDDAGAPPLDDAGAPPLEDAGTPPLEDAGTPPLEDAGTPPLEDAGAPPLEDAGTPPLEDAGAPPFEDAGTPPFDAGPPPLEDAGPPPADGGCTLVNVGGLGEVENQSALESALAGVQGACGARMTGSMNLHGNITDLSPLDPVVVIEGSVELADLNLSDLGFPNLVHIGGDLEIRSIDGIEHCDAIALVDRVQIDGTVSINLSGPTTCN